MKRTKVLLMLFMSSLPFVSDASDAGKYLENCIPHAGDSYVRQLLPYVYEGHEGTDQLWDFSGINAIGGYVVRYETQGDTLKMHNDDKVLYLDVTEDGVWQTGYETSLENMSYGPRVPFILFPLAYGERRSVNYSGEGSYCGTHYMREQGTCQMKADGMGQLVMADGDTLQNVLRVHVITTTALRVNRDSLMNDIENMKQIITEKYQWYASDYRYPVFETVISTSYHGLKPVATQQHAARYLPDEHILLKNNTDDEYQQPIPGQSHSVFRFNAHYNGDHIAITYSLAAQATLRIIVANASGMLIKSEEHMLTPGDSCTLEVDCRGLRKGQYVLYMNIDGNVYNQKFAVK